MFKGLHLMGTYHHLLMTLLIDKIEMIECDNLNDFSNRIDI